MVEFMLSKFREKCCYCYSSIAEGIHVCRCNLSFCNYHFTNVHCRKRDCTILYNVKYEDELMVTSDVYDKTDIEDIQRSIALILKCNNYDERVVFKENEVECKDILDIKNETKIQIGKLDTLTCKDCDIQGHLYVCLKCGYIGCGRVQYGVEGNGHAYNHFKQTDHSIFVLIASITSEYICDTFCYKCEDFIVNPFCESLITCAEFANIGNGWIDIQCNETDESFSVNSPFTGIKNAGNTCYIASVIQLISYVLSKENTRLDAHFYACDKNPLECLHCQLFRVLIRCSDSRSHATSTCISMVDCLRLIWKEFPAFEKNVQQDANEFLMVVLQLLKELHVQNSDIPDISTYFKSTILVSNYCAKCNKTTKRTEEHYMFFTMFAHNVQTCIDSFFESTNASCECGYTRVVTCELQIMPKYLILTVGRCKFEDNQLLKITNEILVDEINLEKYVIKPTLSNYFVNELKNKGYTETEIRIAQLKPEDAAQEETITRCKKIMRTKSTYNISGAIIHTGNSMTSGHYMWIAKHNDEFFLVNDKKITESNVDYFTDSYIMLYE